MNDDGLAARDATRAARPKALVPPVDRDVTERVVGRPRVRATPADSRSIRGAAGAPHVLEQAGAVEPGEPRRAALQTERGWNLTGRMDAIDHLFGAIYLLLGARLLLALVSAAPADGIVRFITWLSDPLYAPFRSLVRVPSAPGGGPLALPILIALVGYMLVHALVSSLLRATRERSPLRERSSLT